MTDVTLFAAGALFTQDCPEEGIAQTQTWGRYRSRELCLRLINALLAGQPDAKVEG